MIKGDFTLLEVMIVLVLVGVLTTVSLPRLLDSVKMSVVTSEQ